MLGRVLSLLRRRPAASPRTTTSRTSTAPAPRPHTTTTPASAAATTAPDLKSPDSTVTTTTEADRHAASNAASHDDFQLPFDIRPKTAADNDSLRALFRDSVLTLGRPHYEADALAAWATTADDADFCNQLDQGTTLVAELYGETAGFAQLYPHDTLRMLYLSPKASGLGIAALLYQHLEDEARLAGVDTLHTASSLAAEHFFSDMGFSRTASETVTRQGQPLPRQQMSKPLHS